MGFPTQKHDHCAPPAPPRLPTITCLRANAWLPCPLCVQILERDWVIPGDGVCSSVGYPWPGPAVFRRALAETIYEFYSLVRVSFVEHEVTIQTLDGKIGRISQVASITQLNDGSWEILVLKAYIPMLSPKLSDIHQSPILNLEYNPFEPTSKDVECWGLDAARDLYTTWLMKKAKRMIENSWFIAAVYYSYLLDHKTRATRFSWMGEN